jgi:uncharacterized protein involved in exopolysaccharide biosynthesis
MTDTHSIPSEPTASEGTDDLFSLLLVLLENFWVLVSFGVGVGLLALTAAYMTPTRYTSTALIDPVAGMPLSDHREFPVLRDERQKLLPLVLAAPDTLAKAVERRQVPARKGDVLVNRRSDGTISLQATSTTPQNAKVLANTVIEVALEKTRPGPAELALLLQKLKTLNEQAEALRKAGEALRMRVATGDERDASGQIAGNLGVIFGQIGVLESRITFNQLIITGMTDQVILEAPTVPVRPSGLKPVAWLLLGAVAGILIGSIWILLKESFKQYRPGPELSARMHALSVRLPFIRKG